jgi:hypothetical protein
MSKWIKIVRQFYIYEEDAYLEEASKGTLPVYNYSERPYFA